MFLLDTVLNSVAENLALDEALLLQAEHGGPQVLRLWEWPAPAVILGAGSRLSLDVDEQACQADGVPVLRRSSGGGTVLLGKGCLLYSLILSYDLAPQLAQVRSSCTWILQRIIDALAPLGVELRQAGTSDLVLGQHKVSGNAQQRKRTHLLHHGTLLCGFNPALVERYLRLPDRQPDYRSQRSHGDFLGNLPLQGTAVRSLLCEAWNTRSRLADWPAVCVRKLVEEKYGQEDWTGRRT
jgi:lipoate-protein ligase A